jgi:hypothetical protein
MGDLRTHSDDNGTGVIVISSCPQPNNVVEVRVTTGTHKGIGWVDVHDLRVFNSTL